MKKRRVFKLLLKFVKNFLRNWHIMITINDYMMMKCSVNINILQNFLLLSILYLFYNMNLLKTCDNIKLRISFTDFINDINILIYESSWSIIAKFFVRSIIDANSDQKCTTSSFQRQSMSWFTLWKSLSDSIWTLM